MNPMNPISALLISTTRTHFHSEARPLRQVTFIPGSTSFPSFWLLLMMLFWNWWLIDLVLIPVLPLLLLLLSHFHATASASVLFFVLTPHSLLLTPRRRWILKFPFYSLFDSQDLVLDLSKIYKAPIFSASFSALILDHCLLFALTASPLSLSTFRHTKHTTLFNPILIGIFRVLQQLD